MVHHARRAGLDFHGADPARLRESDREDEVPELVRAACRNRGGRGHFKNKIGWAQLPLGGVAGRLRQFGCITFRHPCGDPTLDGGDVFVWEAAAFLEVAIAGLGQPWRHVARGGHGFHEAAPAFGVGVTHQREWACAAGMMASRAVLVHERCNVAAPGGIALGRLYVALARGRRDTCGHSNGKDAGCGDTSSHLH